MPTSPSVVPSNHALAEDDLHAWAGRQAALIRSRQFNELDVDRIAGELDDVGSKIYERLESALTILYMHMLKWDFQPDRRSRSWEATIREQRKRVARLLAENPSLKARLEAAEAAGYSYGRDRASGETDLAVETLPETSGYTLHDVIERPFRIDPPAVVSG